MGIRLHGPALPSPGGQMITEGVPLGAVQAPPDGQPIVLFVEHQTTAGRPADCPVRGTPDHRRVSQAGQRDIGGFLAARPVAPARPGALRAHHHGRRARVAARAGGVAIFAMNMDRIKIDLNCDRGELDDAAHEAALMAYITSANISCGGHAGDARTMERTARLALGRGVRIGAHPGYPDRENFGRVEIAMTVEAIADTVYAQIARL